MLCLWEVLLWENLVAEEKQGPQDRALLYTCGNRPQGLTLNSLRGVCVLTIKVYG